MNRLSISIACAGLVWLGCGRWAELEERGPVEAERFINTVGTHPLYGGKLVVKVYEEEGQLNYRVTRVYGRRPFPRESAGPNEPSIENGEDWFAFVESVDAVWIFNGEDALNLVEFSEEGPSPKTSDSVIVPEIFSRAPEAVRERLRESFVKDFDESGT